MAQNVYLLPFHIKPALKLVRPVIVDGPIVTTGDRFLVTEAALDLSRHRVRLRCEQLVFDPAVVVGLIIDERWDLELLEPVRLIFDERWDLDEDASTDVFHDERWDVDLSTPADLFRSERWEI